MLRFQVMPEKREAIEKKMEEYSTDIMAAYLRKITIDGYVIHLEFPEVSTLRDLEENRPPWLLWRTYRPFHQKRSFLQTYTLFMWHTPSG